MSCKVGDRRALPIERANQGALPVTEELEADLRGGLPGDCGDATFAVPGFEDSDDGQGTSYVFYLRGRSKKQTTL
jgi:hypothetical protein